MQNKNIALSVVALLCAFVIHYLVYAYRFMWYLDHPNFIKLLSAYAGFILATVVVFVVLPRWWVMGPLALLAMFAPAIIGVHYLVPIGAAFVFVAIACSALFAGVAILRSKRVTRSRERHERP